jgi:hypothetical protein
MATRRRGPGQGSGIGEGSAEWRQLDARDRFTILLNHYGSADALSEVTGIPARSIRAVFTSAILKGQNSQKLQSDEFRAGFQRARHRMTDHLRRRVENAAKGRYEAPIVRTRNNVIEPEKRSFVVEYRGFDGKLRRTESKSQWFLYKVEFLPEAEIFSIVAQLYDLFMDTGQFNTMRVEYIVKADEYFNGEYIKDRELRNAARQMEYIKLSSQQRSFSEDNNGPDYATAWLSWWRGLDGGERITDLCFAHFEDIASGTTMREAQRDFKLYKKGKGKRGNKRKGKGRGI